MKKYVLFLLIGLFTFSLTACNDDEKKESANTAETKSDEEAAAEAKEMQKKLDKQKVEENTVVAIVNGQELKGSDYNAQLNIAQTTFQQMGQDPTTDEVAKQVKDYTLENLVGQTLLMQEVDKKGYKATDEAINKKLETIKGQYKDEKAFEQALKNNNITLDELKKQISDEVRYSQYIENDLKVEEVKEEDVKKYYDTMVSSLKESDDKSTEVPEYKDVKETLKVNLESQKTQEKLSEKVEELKKAAKIELKI
ncbi:SurA N-terminal domain-containing protein [Metabacillus niabensis]|uniref:peptidylprolyl isomerase n=1 Tax=Metabacillus niabensis TaxID=324854 RepID=A0ABT9YXD8_9BACI|nr:SurA N-terminal domain-containing protein [Metabacillus niabensis]MDQ0223730.1 hypothetical protein [Metabacillus niabensis]PAD67875.1 peptidylprolyl isomerase [Bacillus sp. 7586-K]